MDWTNCAPFSTQLIVNTEICPESKRRHYQGYVRCKKAVSLAYLKAKFPTAHWEKRKGSHDQAKAYHTKEETRQPGTFPFLSGEDPAPGRRTDLIDWKETIDSGACDMELWESHFSCMLRYSSGLRAYRLACALRRTTPPKIYVYWGKTGTGKSRKAFALEEELKTVAFWKPKGQWFDGYEGQTMAVFDDFRGDVPFRVLLQILDRYPMIVPVKGGYVNWNPKVIVFTSNYCPRAWYKPENEVDALMRRLNEFGSIEQLAPVAPTDDLLTIPSDLTVTDAGALGFFGATLPDSPPW